MAVRSPKASCNPGLGRVADEDPRRLESIEHRMPGFVGDNVKRAARENPGGGWRLARLDEVTELERLLGAAVKGIDGVRQPMRKDLEVRIAASIPLPGQRAVQGPLVHGERLVDDRERMDGVEGVRAGW